MEQRQTKEEEIQQITEISGVSRSTIFRYLAGKKIRYSSQQGIEQALQQIKQQHASSHTSEDNMQQTASTTEIIVSINTSTFDQFQGNSEALSGIIEESGRQNVRIRLERDMKSDSLGSGVIILGKHDPEETEECEMLRSSGIPFVVINRMIEEKHTSYVASNVEACGYDVCMHLISQGCKRILFWGEQETRVSRDKFKGYCRALQDSGIAFDQSLVFSNTTPLAEMFRKISGISPRPDAFMSMDDETATVAIRLAVENNLRIPQDIAISGMNDLGSSKSIIPSLTSVRIPFRKLGTLALQTLLRNISDPDMMAEKITVRHELIVRDSTRRNRE